LQGLLPISLDPFGMYGDPFGMYVDPFGMCVDNPACHCTRRATSSIRPSVACLVGCKVPVLAVGRVGAHLEPSQATV